MIQPGRPLWVLGRIVVAIFCWATAAYAFVTSSAFAYLQFIRPRVFRSVGAFSDWHGAMLWGWLILLAALLWPDLRFGKAKAAARACVLACTAAAILSLFDPILPSLTEGSRSVLVGVFALVPPVWLAVIDHLQSADFLRRQALPASENGLRGVEGRLFISTFATALFVTGLYAAPASIAAARAFEPDLTGKGMALGLGSSVIDHFLIAGATFLSAAAITRVIRRSFVRQHIVLSAILTIVLAIVFGRLVGHAIGLEGLSDFAAAVAVGLSVVGTWSALRLRRFDADHAVLDVAPDVYFGPARSGGLSIRGLLSLVAVALLAYASDLAAGHMDWDGLLLKCAVVAVWLTAFGSIHRLVKPRPSVRDALIASVCLLPLAAHAALQARGLDRHTLDRYAVYNASFRLADGVTHTVDAAPSFDRFLRANTGLTDVTVGPIDIDFVPNLSASQAAEKPRLFLFVIDSLRPDYLGAYNPAVRFTPAIDKFASESVLFTNAFTRYGGTGLSVPAIWAGSAILHKQYVKPFHPMNALEKLLDANGYRRYISLDSILQQLLAPSHQTIELDRGVTTMDYEFCKTLDELNGKLATTDSSTPVFAYSLPQDVHVSRLAAGSVSQTAFYAPFYAPYASRVQNIDVCFGRFVEGLKRRGEYDRSLIVVTSDHGEMLGEDGRFGHSYHLFPQVVRVPLIVHLPASLAAQRPDDLDAVRLSTDITPTLYAALGYRPTRANELMGRPFTGEDKGSLVERRRDSYVLAASYGAVYAVLRQNGRRLYIADAVNNVDYEYERGTDGHWVTVDVSADMRAINQFAVRQYVYEISRLYHVSARL